jgi:para-aminobenzoate synthetase/4-amino-4-deoxychorismate lyase
MNVAIRTITINRKTNDGIMGLGSGIVWDSNPQSEFQEVKLKSKFLTEPLDYFEIFETMRYENGEIKFLDDHFNRMKSAADYFLLKFDEKKIRKLLVKSIEGIDKQKTKKIKLTLTKWGEVRIEIADIPNATKKISAIISQSKIDSTDKFRYFKTTNRKLYDDEFALYNSKGFYDVLYLNEKDEVAEGSRTNIVIRKNGAWFTPKCESGALPGIYRKYFIGKNPEVSEKIIKVDDLLSADEVLLTNALRGEVSVQKLYITPKDYITYKK